MDGGELSFTEAWLGAFAFTLQLYFDFSGYCDIALGAALLFGIRLPINFHSPLKSASIIEFWRHWHMTLSRFLRDYLYVPLGGNRRGSVRRYINLLLTMLLGGLWHGANWTFVVWGGLHGLYLVLNHGWRRFVPARMRMNGGLAYRTIRVAVTLIAVVLAFVVFRADSIGAAAYYLVQLLDVSSVSVGDAYAGEVRALFASDISYPLVEIVGVGLFSMLFVGLGLAIALLLPNSMELIAAEDIGWQLPSGPDRATAGQWARRYPAAALVVLCFLGWASLNSLTSLSPFLYFQF